MKDPATLQLKANGMTSLPLSGPDSQQPTTTVHETKVPEPVSMPEAPPDSASPPAPNSADSQPILNKPTDTPPRPVVADRDNGRERDGDRAAAGRRREQGSPSNRSRGYRRSNQRSDDSDNGNRRRYDTSRKRLPRKKSPSRSPSYPSRNPRDRSRSNRGPRNSTRKSSSVSTSTSRSKSRSPSKEVRTCEKICIRLAEYRAAPYSRKKSLEREVYRLIDCREFYAEDRRGKKISLDQYVDLCLCKGRPMLHKRILAKVSSRHSFAVEFEVFEDYNRITLFECKKGKLTRAYYFKDRDDVTTRNVSLTDILSCESFKNIRKYLSKKGVKDADMSLVELRGRGEKQ